MSISGENCFFNDFNGCKKPSFTIKPLVCGVNYKILEDHNGYSFKLRHWVIYHN